MKPIDTIWNGYRFRSRLEARWAVFMSTLGVEYVYEPEGFDLGDGIYYLPDFWLPRQEVWLEIKSGAPTHDEQIAASRLARQSWHQVVILSGQPRAPEFYWGGDNRFGYEGRMYLGDPFQWDFNTQVDERMRVLHKSLINRGHRIHPSYYTEMDMWCEWIELDRKDFHEKRSNEARLWPYGITDRYLQWQHQEHLINLSYCFGTIQQRDLYLSSKMINAYNAAGQARFEHGEKP